jgi:hypothetical protein
MNQNNYSLDFHKASEMVYLQMNAAESLYIDEIIKSNPEIHHRYYAFELGVATFFGINYLNISSVFAEYDKFIDYLKYYANIKYQSDAHQVVKFWEHALKNHLMKNERLNGYDSVNNRNNPGHFPGAYLVDALGIDP